MKGDVPASEARERGRQGVHRSWYVSQHGVISAKMLMLLCVAASPALKALSKKFGALHGVSALANLGAVISLLVHGLWIGNGGL